MKLPAYVKWVKAHEVPAWIAVGWTLNQRPLPGSHGEWSIAVEWWRECDCVIPGKGDAQWTGTPQQETSTNTEPGQ